jgi:DNA-directed RNA polymerase subunit K/omega
MTTAYKSSTPKPSRGPTVDHEKCLQQAGGNRYNMILIAAQRAREIARKHRVDERKDAPYPVVNALAELEAGAYGIEYLKKLR